MALAQHAQQTNVMRTKCPTQSVEFTKNRATGNMSDL